MSGATHALSPEQCPTCGGRVEYVDGHRVEYHGPICPQCPLTRSWHEQRRASPPISNPPTDGR